MSSGAGTAGRGLAVMVLLAMLGAVLAVAVHRAWSDVPGGGGLAAVGPKVAGEGGSGGPTPLPARIPDGLASATDPVSSDPILTVAAPENPEASWAAVPGTTATAAPGTTPTPSATEPTAADRAAGVRTMRVPERGTGVLSTVSGRTPVPSGPGPVHRVRIRVEGGLGIDRERFAEFVLTVLNDGRSWGAAGRMRFARTDAATADLDVVLASPRLSERMCRPLQTGGTVSCRNGRFVVLTAYRWVLAVPDYGQDRTGYRRYVVNHEVGHWLGNGHRRCSGTGRRAPVMMQQTLGLRGCRPNPWPYPDAGTDTGA